MFDHFQTKNFRLNAPNIQRFRTTTKPCCTVKEFHEPKTGKPNQYQNKTNTKWVCHSVFENEIPDPGSLCLGQSQRVSGVCFWVCFAPLSSGRKRKRGGLFRGCVSGGNFAKLELPNIMPYRARKDYKPLSTQRDCSQRT